MARTSKNTEATPIDADTLAALAAFQEEYGEDWRSKLVVAWMYGQVSICGLTLYKARNEYGNRLLA